MVFNDFIYVYQFRNLLLATLKKAKLTYFFFLIIEEKQKNDN